MSRFSPNGERVFSGIPVSSGIAQGRVRIVDSGTVDVIRRSIEASEVSNELARLNKAIVATRFEVQAIQRRVAAALGAKEADVFEAHLLVLEDPTLLDQVKCCLEKELVNVEHAFHVTAERYASALEASEDEYLAERAADLRDVAGRVLHQLTGSTGDRDLAHLPHPCVIVARDLSPSIAATLDREKVLGFATETGGKTSHTAILARRFGIPAIVGACGLTTAIESGEHILLDGHSGTIVLNPTDQTLFAYGQLQRRRAALGEKLPALRDQPAVTLDGHRVTLAANIDEPSDIAAALAHGAEGVGLFRSEFLFLNRSTVPDEETQYLAYREVAERIAPHPVVIRTLDLGGDKLPSSTPLPKEPNPFLGWRAIRISLECRELFRTQLRAILRASVHGRVRVLFPMISSVEELETAKEETVRCREILAREGCCVPGEMEIGAMIEIPSAALIAPALAQRVQFFSIGTNDLTQYTLAVDRLNSRVASLYQCTHPGILRLIDLTIQAAKQRGIPVTVCGEMAGDLAVVPLLIGLGVSEFSATPSVLPAVKFLIRRLKLSETQELAAFALRSSSAQEVLDRSKALACSAAADLFEGS